MAVDWQSILKDSLSAAGGIVAKNLDPSVLPPCAPGQTAMCNPGTTAATGQQIQPKVVGSAPGWYGPFVLLTYGLGGLAAWAGRVDYAALAVGSQVGMDVYGSAQGWGGAPMPIGTAVSATLSRRLSSPIGLLAIGGIIGLAVLRSGKKG